MDVCSYSFEKDINEKTGSVQSKVLDGTLYLGFIDLPPKNILEWGIKHKPKKNARLRVMKTDDGSGSFITEEEVILEQAACTGLKIRYDRYGTSHFRTFITICANNIKVGDGYNWVRKDWQLLK